MSSLLLRRAIVSVLLIVLILGGGALIAHKLKSMKKEPKQVEREYKGPLVQAVSAESQSLDVVIRGTGTIRAKQSATVVPQVAGKVMWVNPSLISGGFFDADEVLLKIERADYKLQVASAQATLAQAQTVLEQQLAQAAAARAEWQSMHPDKEPASSLVFREPQVKEAQARLAGAQASLEKAELDLSRTEISLPFAGRVIRESVDPGEYVRPGDVLAEVYGVAVMEVAVPLDDKELAWFNGDRPVGNKDMKLPATVSAQFADQQHQWPGYVTRLEGQVDAQSRMVHVVVEVPDPFSGPMPLIPGMFVKVAIVGKTLDPVFLLPRHAVHSGQVVWVVTDGELSIKPVSVARYDAESAYITEGLQDGDTVIVSMIDTVTDGMLVRVAKDKQ